LAKGGQLDFYKRLKPMKNEVIMKRSKGVFSMLVVVGCLGGASAWAQSAQTEGATNVPASGPAILSVDGTPEFEAVLDSAQLVGVNWQQGSSYSNVTITAQVQGWYVGGSGTAYLTRSVGPGSAEADEVARSQFSFPSSYAPVPLFSGLDLPPGTYYLTLAADAGADGLWEIVSGTAATVTTAPDVTLLPDYFSFEPSSYPPSSPMYQVDPQSFRALFAVKIVVAPKPNSPPVAKSKNIEVTADAACQATITPSDVDDGSFDPDGDPISFTLNPTGPLSLGANMVTLAVTDSNAQSNSSSCIVTVVDRTAPTITGGSASPTVLWPPNRRMVDVWVSYESVDACGSTVSTLEVTSNESINSGGAGSTSSDIEIIDAHHVLLRADRSDPRRGRVYTITIICTDQSGNVTRRSVEVVVPVSQKNGGK
jgi:hypothetical protein